MKLPELPAVAPISGKRIFLRVDWNVPLSGAFASEDSLKVSRTINTIRSLSERGAIVLVATHLGRPKGRDASLSTRKLLRPIADQYTLKMEFLGDAIDTATGLKAVKSKTEQAKPGTIFLLENVRFYKGEETNAPALAKAYASLADVFVNDAFASCHRMHASVVGVAKLLPRYAGPTLVREVGALEQLIGKPKRPYVAIIGGAKLSTKFPVLSALVQTADRVMVGGAMANVFLKAQGREIGKSFVEKEGMPFAKKLLKNKKILLPVDAVVASSLKNGAKVRVSDVRSIKKTEMIGDIGPTTMRQWAMEIKMAKTIVWNGPMGVTEIPSFSHGSLTIARAVALVSKGPTFGVAGGGDTLPVVMRTGMEEWIDHLSTGGGAMLEYLALKGKLPGLLALQKA